MLPKYPTNRRVLLEVARQLAACAKALRHKHGNGIPIPISLGNSLEVCPNFQAAASVEKELSLYLFTSFASRDKFDPYGYVEETVGKKYKHVFQVEDFWMNAQDDMEIKKKMDSRLPLDLIRKCKIYRVADQAQDSGRYLQPSYEKEDKEVKVNWDEQEVTDMRELMDPILSCTHRWVDV